MIAIFSNRYKTLKISNNCYNFPHSSGVCFFITFLNFLGLNIGVGGAELEKGVAVIGSVVLTLRLRRSSSLDFENCWGTSWEGTVFDKEDSRSFALEFG